MPEITKTTESASTTNTGATATTEAPGMFDGAAEQASADAAGVEANEAAEAENNNAATETETVNTDDNQTSETQTELNEDGTPKAEVTVTAKPIVIRGREFANADELAKAYESSSDEGLRLSSVTKAMEQDLMNARNYIYDLEAKQANAPYPGELTDEQLSELSPAKQTDYVIKKNAYEAEKAKKLAGIETGKKDYQKHIESVRSEMAEIEADMSKDEGKYPEFSRLSDFRKEIINKTPWIDGRPETPYISYLLAYAVNALSEKATSTKLKAGADQKVKDSAAATVAATKTTQTKAGTPANKKDETDPVVAAWRKRNGSVF